MSSCGDRGRVTSRVIKYVRRITCSNKKKSKRVSLRQPVFFADATVSSTYRSVTCSHMQLRKFFSMTQCLINKYLGDRIVDKNSDNSIYSVTMGKCANCPNRWCEDYFLILLEKY